MLPKARQIQLIKAPAFGEIENGSSYDYIFDLIEAENDYGVWN